MLHVLGVYYLFSVDGPFTQVVFSLPFRDKTAETKQVTLVALIAAAEPELELRGSDSNTVHVL